MGGARVTTCRVATCDHPVDDAWVCMRCSHRLQRALGDTTYLVGQLDVILAKQAAYRDRNERRSAETPLPIDLRAAELSSQLRGHYVAWVRLISEERGRDLPKENLPAMARWLLHHVEWLRHHEAGADAIDEICGDIDAVRRLIDIPPYRTTFTFGPCPETSGRNLQASLAITHPDVPVTMTTEPCPGEVRAYIPTDESKPARWECNVCLTVWPPIQWNRAGQRIKKRRNELRKAVA